MVELRHKSIHDLRTIAQSFGVSDIFGKDAIHLAQEIELKQEKLIPPPIAAVPKPEYDARLMDKPPGRRANMDEITTILEGHIKRGLKLTFDEEHWYMYSGKKNDTGSIRMPLKHVLTCADNVMR